MVFFLFEVLYIRCFHTRLSFVSFFFYKMARRYKDGWEICLANAEKKKEKTCIFGFLHNGSGGAIFERKEWKGFADSESR